MEGDETTKTWHETSHETSHGTWRETWGEAGRTVLPYWFAVCGIALGIGGVIQGEPLAGACGAVAGVTAGLLHQHRSAFHARQVEALRRKLRRLRTESEAQAEELRQTISALQTELADQRQAAAAAPGRAAFLPTDWAKKIGEIGAEAEKSIGARTIQTQAEAVAQAQLASAQPAPASAPAPELSVDPLSAEAPLSAEESLSAEEPQPVQAKDDPPGAQVFDLNDARETGTATKKPPRIRRFGRTG